MCRLTWKHRIYISNAAAAASDTCNNDDITLAKQTSKCYREQLLERVLQIERMQHPPTSTLNDMTYILFKLERVNKLNKTLFAADFLCRYCTSKTINIQLFFCHETFPPVVLFFFVFAKCMYIFEFIKLLSCSFFLFSILY